MLAWRTATGRTVISLQWELEHARLAFSGERGEATSAIAGNLNSRRRHPLKYLTDFAVYRCHMVDLIAPMGGHRRLSNHQTDGQQHPTPWLAGSHRLCCRQTQFHAAHATPTQRARQSQVMTQEKATKVTEVLRAVRQGYISERSGTGHAKRPTRE